MNKAIGILALIFVLSFQQGCRKSEFLVITGVVRDSVTNKPIEGAYIITSDGDLYVSSSDGTFTIDKLKPGKNRFTAYSFRGYAGTQKDFTITNDRVTKIDFNLKPVAKPELETGRVTGITNFNAVITGKFKMKDGVSVVRYGHCWSYSTNFPTLEDCTGASSNWWGSGEQTFTTNMNGLTQNTVYYVRAYAQTDAGIVYGNTVVFKSSVLEVSHGLIAYFPFSNSFDDQSGNGNYLYSWGTYLTNDRFGNPGNALAFTTNGVANSYSELFASFNQFAFSFWFNQSSWSGSEKTMINTGFPNYTSEIRIGEDASPNKLFFYIKTQNGNTYKVHAASGPSLHTWHHVVAQRDQYAIQIYLDGVLQESLPCDNQPILNDSWNEGYGYVFYGLDIKFWPYKYYTGLLDDIRVYNRSLTTSEIDYLKSH